MPPFSWVIYLLARPQVANQQKKKFCWETSTLIMQMFDDSYCHKNLFSDFEEVMFEFELMLDYAFCKSPFLNGHLVCLYLNFRELGYCLCLYWMMS